jgi:hypothetical protein
MKYIIKGWIYILFMAILIIKLFVHWLLLIIWTFKLNPLINVTDSWGHFVGKIRFSTHIKYRVKQLRKQLTS